jgi:hypothetical protein
MILFLEAEIYTLQELDLTQGLYCDQVYQYTSWAEPGACLMLNGIARKLIGIDTNFSLFVGRVLKQHVLNGNGPSFKENLFSSGRLDEWSTLVR